MIWASGVIDEIHKIYAYLKSPVSCTLDTHTQEEIDQTYENIISATCNLEK